MMNSFGLKGSFDCFFAVICEWQNESQLGWKHKADQCDVLPIYDAMVLFLVFHCKKISDLNMRKPVCDVKPDEILVSDCFLPFNFPQQIKIIY